MVDDYLESQLSELIKSVSDTTRRQLLTQLCQQGPQRVTELASCYDMSLNAVSKHIKILESAQLVKRTTYGRDHWIEADLHRFELIENWFRQMKSIWELRLEALDRTLTGEKND
ncbi:MAG: metalloregulator ArsR/SmtB family transcription factor [Pseudomonadota bacterium]